MNIEFLKLLEQYTTKKEPCSKCLISMKCNISCDKLQMFIHSIPLETLNEILEQYRKFSLTD